MTQQQELFEPGEYIRTDGPGWFTIAARPGGKWAEKHYQLPFLPQVIHGLDPRLDTWISQATFRHPRRLAANFRDVALLFADLDTYNIAGLKYMSPVTLSASLQIYCVEILDIPSPSIILFSGRGLQAKWLLEHPLGEDELIRWTRLNGALSRCLLDFGADMKSRDISRVLRLDRTVNTKSGEVVRVLHVEGDPPVRHDIEDLEMRLLRWMEPERQAVTKTGMPSKKPLWLQRFNQRSLAWWRLKDLERLWTMRGGRVPPGFRDITLFWWANFFAVADPRAGHRFWQELEAFAARWMGSAWFHREGRAALSTVYRKMKAMIAGGQATVNGRLYRTPYLVRTQTLIELFQVEPAEMRHLRAIIDKDEKKRRHREREKKRHRERGGLTWEERRASTITGQKPWETEGISRAQWYRRRKATRTK